MIKFYRNSAIALVLLLIVSSLVLYTGYRRCLLSVSLFPNESGFEWVSSIEPPEPAGQTQIAPKSELGSIEYEFFLDMRVPYPYTHYSLTFVEEDTPYAMADFTAYDSISFRISCDPENVLLLAFFTYDSKVTDLEDATTRRVNSKAFSCEKSWQQITIPFEDIVTPDWWLSGHGYQFSENDYELDKVMAVAFINSLQSPVGTHSNVRLSDITLLGEERSPLYISIALTLICWVLVVAYLVREYVRVLTRDLRERLQRDQSLIAYKKLTIEPQKDKEKKALLRYMATEYADPDLSLETAAHALGINRTKINELLKEELQLTFSSYLNKLRLTEAARLLSELESTNISEIAYSVGYNNVPYFNKLFKKEYGCTPKTFQSLSR